MEPPNEVYLKHLLNGKNNKEIIFLEGKNEKICESRLVGKPPDDEINKRSKHNGVQTMTLENGSNTRSKSIQTTMKFSFNQVIHVYLNKMTLQKDLIEF